MLSKGKTGIEGLFGNGGADLSSTVTFPGEFVSFISR